MRSKTTYKALHWSQNIIQTKDGHILEQRKPKSTLLRGHGARILIYWAECQYSLSPSTSFEARGSYRLCSYKKKCVYVAGETSLLPFWKIITLLGHFYVWERRNISQILLTKMIKTISSHLSADMKRDAWRHSNGCYSWLAQLVTVHAHIYSRQPYLDLTRPKMDRLCHFSPGTPIVLKLKKIIVNILNIHWSILATKAC